MTSRSPWNNLKIFVLMLCFFLYFSNGAYSHPTKCVSANKLRAIELQLLRLTNQVKGLYGGHQGTAKDCAEYRERGHITDGVYIINPSGQFSFSVRCDMTTDGGGWTIFQRRIDGSVNFYRNWHDYKVGFGDKKNEYWLGLDNIHALTTLAKNQLRIDMRDTTGKTAYAQYTFFAVTSEHTKYQLSLGTYSGTAGDSLTYHRGFPFSTKDSDNDKYPENCAVSFKGAWWYGKCHSSNLNGQYHHGSHTSYADGINWFAWKGYHYSLGKTEMKIRRVNFKKDN